MSVIIGQQPVKHNYYTPEDFLRYDQNAGSLGTRTDSRAIHVSEDFLIGLHAGLEEEVGDAAPVVMYKMGFQWGLADIRHFEAVMAREFGRDVQDMNLQFVMEQWWWPPQVMGWGAWEIDFESKQNEGLVIVNVFDSAVAKSLGEIGKPVCYVYAGLFAGVLTHLSRRPLAGIEIQCYAVGADYCRFVIGSEKRLNAIEFWLEEGASADEVLRRL